MLGFMIGAMLAIVPGLITGWLLFTLVGWLMKRDDYTRHRYEPAPALAPAPVRVTADRVPAPAPVVVNVVIPGLPQPAPAMWPGVVEGQVVRELPPARWGN